MDSLCLWLTLFIGLRILADFLYTHDINLTGGNHVEMGEEGGEAQHSWNLKFFGTASLVAISGPKKVSIFRAHPFQWPVLWMLPASKSLRPAPYKH